MNYMQEKYKEAFAKETFEYEPPKQETTRKLSTHLPCSIDCFAYED